MKNKFLIQINSKKYKIFHITRFYNLKKTGGIEEVIKQISYYSKYNHYVLSVGEKENIKKISNNLVSIIFKKNLTLFSDVFSLRLFLFILSANLKKTIFHVHYPHLFGLFYVTFLKKSKIIVSHHSDILKFKKINFLLKFLLKKLYKKIFKFHISSKKYFKNSEINDYKNKTIFEPFSIKLNKINSKKKLVNYDYVLFIGRDTYYKGFDILEKIISLSKDINFVCITNHKFQKNYKNLKIFKNISEKKKNNLIKNSKLIISTSINRAESFGVSMLEGLMMNKPLMCFKIDTGINDIVINNFNGYVIKKFNTKEFINKITKVYSDKKLQKKFSKNSKKHSLKFKSNYRILNQEYENIFSKQEN